jgi:hypothetical protein
MTMNFTTTTVCWRRLAALCVALAATNFYSVRLDAQRAASASPDGHKLNFRATAFGSYTEDALAGIARGGGDLGTLPGIGASGSRSDGRSESGIFTGGSGSLTYEYSKQRARTSFNLNARSGGSYYPDLNVKALQNTVDLSVSRQFGGRTTLYLKESARMSDHYRFELFPDLASPDPEARLQLGDEYALVSSTTYAYTSAASLSRKLSTRATTSVNYSLKYVTSPEETLNFTSHTAGASFQYQLTQYGTLRASYAYREAPRNAGQAAGEDLPFYNHDVSLGVDYNRAFSLSGKRTSLTFGTGSSLMASGTEQVHGETTTTDSKLRPVFLGSVTLRRNLGRTWDAQAGYRRMVVFMEGFTQPILTDGVSANVGGQLSQRVTFTAMGAYAAGAVGRARSSSNNHDSQTASAQLGVLLTRHLTFSSVYFYVRHRIGDDVVLPEGFPRNLDRHSFRVGLTLQLPLIS